MKDESKTAGRGTVHTSLPDSQRSLYWEVMASKRNLDVTGGH